MKTVGLIGGVGPESTVDYYQRLIAGYRQQNPGKGYPSIIINSINLDNVVDLITAGKLLLLADYLVGEIDRLAKAGAHFGAITANTPHVVFDEVRSRAAIPLISIVETTGTAAKAMGLERVGLFGTRFTMQGRFYPDVFDRVGVDLIIPTNDEVAYIHDKYMNELIHGKFLNETRMNLIGIAERMKMDDRIEGLILGGTELPLLMRDEQPAELPLLDTTELHVQAILRELIF
jgi:aspartate racemase